MRHEQIYDQVLEAAAGLSRRSSRRQELRARDAAQRARWGGVDGLYVRAGEFHCLQCGALVTVDPLYSGGEQPQPLPLLPVVTLYGPFHPR